MNPKMENVIKGLETCYCPPSKCNDCPYHDLPDGQSCNDVLCLDALSLLKEQDDQIEQLEHDLAVTQNNLNYYVNGND